MNVPEEFVRLTIPEIRGMFPASESVQIENGGSVVVVVAGGRVVVVGVDSDIINIS